MKGIDYHKSQVYDMLEVKTCTDDLHSYRDHLHQELSIGFIEKGATWLKVNGKDYYIEEKEAIIIYPFVSHKCQPVDIENWEFTMIYIDSGFCSEIIDINDKKHAIGIKKLGDEEFERIRKLAHFLKSDESSFSKEIELISTLLEILDTCDIDIKLESDEKLNRVKEYIEAHFLEAIQLKDMENEFDINRFVLIRSFGNKFNTTPNAYQLQLKVNYARQLLKGCGSMADIAVAAGFYDQAHFTREFKKAYGVTPLQYYKDIH
ncbi:MAG: AraC family transcriptional regulator [Pseudomonadota bacterium]